MWFPLAPPPISLAFLLTRQRTVAVVDDFLRPCKLAFSFDCLKNSRLRMANLSSLESDVLANSSRINRMDGSRHHCRSQRLISYLRIANEIKGSCPDITRTRPLSDDVLSKFQFVVSITSLMTLIWLRNLRWATWSCHDKRRPPTGAPPMISNILIYRGLKFQRPRGLRWRLSFCSVVRVRRSYEYSQ